MTDTKPNAQLAYMVLDHIDAHPEQHDQQVWIHRGDGCGTVACLAGWACLLADDRPDFHKDDPEACDVFVGGGRLPVKERAAQLLGIPYDRDAFYGHALFNIHHTREDLDRLVAEIFGPRPGVPVPGVPPSGCDCADDGGQGPTFSSPSRPPASAGDAMPSAELAYAVQDHALKGGTR